MLQFICKGWEAFTWVVRTLSVTSAVVPSAQSQFYPVLDAYHDYVRCIYACYCFGRIKATYYFIFGISKSRVFCSAVTSPTPHLLLPPLVSLFSINSSQSLYNPCNNPRERASKTFFFLTLIPMDPILLWHCSPSQDILANRILGSQELALAMYSKGERNTLPIGDQIHTRSPGISCPATTYHSSRYKTHQSLFLLAHGGFLPSKNYSMPARCQINVHTYSILFILWSTIKWLLAR